MPDVILSIAWWLVRALAAFLALAAALPFLRVGWWPVRLCDFPRLQLGVLALVGVAGVVAHGLLQAWRAEHATLLVVMLAVASWQLSHAIPYSPLWRKGVADAESGSPSLRLAVLNLDYENPRRSEALRMIESLDADILVLIEVDAEWARTLATLEQKYGWREGVVLEDGLGLLVWSRVRLSDAQTRCLVTDDRASVLATIEWPDMRPVRFVAVHPSPPGLGKDHNDDEREDSRKRDAELVMVAKEVAQRADEAHIVAGDFNDVAWSHTTRLFERLSGLRDPRVGRGLLTTYHARYPMLRYPIDHVFVSDGFRVAALSRVVIPGSDHLGILADLAFSGRNGVTPEPVKDDHEEASQIVEKGKEDAREDGER